MKTLHLNLKRQWFDMIKSGEKNEEYREIKEFYQRRFIDFFCGRPMDYKYNEGSYHFNNYLLLGCDFITSKIQWKIYDSITFSNGYAKDRPQFEIELKGISIKEGRSEWGAVKGEKYFVLELGEIIEKPNCRLGYENDEYCVTAPCHSCRYNESDY